jgi:YfiH family protein
MLRKIKNDIEWLEFELLAAVNLKHGVFLSELDFGSQEADTVRKRREHVKCILNIPALVSGKQCHGNNVSLVNSELDYPTCDALATKKTGLGLLLCHADCQAAILYDPMNHAVANVHSGWRGSVQNIFAETVTFMKNSFGTNPKDLLVGISPSLGPNNAEFVHYKSELPETFWDFQIKPNYFDFWAISRWQLSTSGVLPHHIQVAEIDTYADEKNFFSYRRNRTSARNGTIVAL